MQGGKTIGDASMASTTLALRFCDLHHEQKISSCPQCAIFSLIYILFMFIKSIKISNQSKTKAWAFTLCYICITNKKTSFMSTICNIFIYRIFLRFTFCFAYIKSIKITKSIQSNKLELHTLFWMNSLCPPRRLYFIQVFFEIFIIKSTGYLIA